MKKISKVVVTGRCHPRAKKLLEDSKYNAGDAVDFFTRAISHPKKRLELEIKVTETEIEDLELELMSKKILLEKLKEQYNSLESVPDKEEQKEIDRIESSVLTLKGIAERLNCQPDEINKYTGKDTLGFHAQKCGVSKDQLISIIVDGGK